MPENLPELLSNVFSDVVENLAFMFAEVPDEGEFPEVNDPCVMAAMGFTGHQEGTIAMAVPESMCTELAANVLGLEPDDEIVSRFPHDALKELLNVTCGNVLTAMAGEEPIFDLTVPETKTIDAAAWKAFRDQPDTVSVLLDENPVLLQFRCNS